MKKKYSFLDSIRNKISWRFASVSSILCYLIFIIIHLAIIIGASIFESFPKNIVWGGMAETASQLINYELIALTIIVLCLLLTLIRTKYIKIKRLYPLSRYAMWVFSVYFLFNTVMNILAETNFEKALSPAAFILSISSLRLALGYSKNYETQH